MTINFQQFINATLLTGPYAARKILYSPESRPAKLAKKHNLDIEGERSLMIKVVAGSEVIEIEEESNTSGIAA